MPIIRIDGFENEKYHENFKWDTFGSSSYSYETILGKGKCLKLVNNHSSYAAYYKIFDISNHSFNKLILGFKYKTNYFNLTPYNNNIRYRYNKGGMFGFFAENDSEYVQFHFKKGPDTNQIYMYYGSSSTYTYYSFYNSTLYNLLQNNVWVNIEQEYDIANNTIKTYVNSILLHSLTDTYNSFIFSQINAVKFGISCLNNSYNDWVQWFDDVYVIKVEDENKDRRLGSVKVLTLRPKEDRTIANVIKSHPTSSTADLLDDETLDDNTFIQTSQGDETTYVSHKYEFDTSKYDEKYKNFKILAHKYQITEGSVNRPEAENSFHYLGASISISASPEISASMNIQTMQGTFSPICSEAISGNILIKDFIETYELGFKYKI